MRFFNGKALNTSSLFLIGFSLILSSCINYKLHKAELNPGNKIDEPISDTLQLTHSIFLIGDAGGSQKNKEPLPALQLLEQHLKKAPEQSSVVFLGDNIYPNGFASKIEAAERTTDEFKLNAQLKTIEDYPGNVFFVAGNHDWYKHGLDGLKREKKFIEKHLDREDVLMPRPGCGDPEVVKINKDLTLILIDTQWWLTNWTNEPEMNDGCDVKSRDLFGPFFEEAIKKNRTKNIVVAMHHPMFSVGAHGGQFNLRQHLFPLTDVKPNLWIPLPLIGSLYPAYRSTIGSRQDLPNSRYKELRDIVVSSAKKNGSFIFAAGHEHNLQYIEKAQQHFIVSGSGSFTSPTKLDSGSEFAYGANGFSKIDFYEDGSAWVQFWVTKDGQKMGELVFKKKIKGPLESIKNKQIEAWDYTLFESGQKSIKVPIGSTDFSKNNFGRLMWGDHYRDVYPLEVEAPILDLTKYKGGVAPIKRGGGYQTNSLRLEAPNGKQYTMRSIKKDASRTVPYPYNKTFVLDIVKDYFSSAHPLSALAIPDMSTPLNIPHAVPELYYVPMQPTLGEFNGDYGNALYLIEERPDDDVWQDAPNFGNPDEVVNTFKTLENVMEEHNHLIDQKAVIKARLFDIVLGDWDRHDDQWRWAQFEENDQKIYRPIPRDRDQAFSNYDGLLTGLARWTLPYTRQLRTFEGELYKLNWISFNARQFDRTFMTELEWSDWLDAAKFIQENLSDQVIEDAFKNNWPENVYLISGPKIIESLKNRRDSLVHEIRPFYETLAKRVDVVGTEKKDLFAIQKLKNGLNIKVYDTNKEGDREALLYERTFLSKETKQVNIYGLGDDDLFMLEGAFKNSIKIRIIGGLGEDTYIESGEGKGGKPILVYDTKQEKKIANLHPSTKTKFTDNPIYNTYNRKSKDYESDYNFFIPSVSFNPDDGLLLGLLAARTTYGFKKDPYASLNQFNGNFALATAGVRLSYKGIFNDLFGAWGIRQEAVYQSALYTTNYYGLGNDTRNLEERNGKNFNRVRQKLFSYRPAIFREFSKSNYYFFGPTFEFIDIEKTPNRIFEFEETEFPDKVFEGLSFLGFEGGVEYVNTDNSAFPSKGFTFQTILGYKTTLNLEDRSFGYIDTKVGFYQKLDFKGNIVFATRVGVSYRENDEFIFYHGSKLGGIGPESNFRGLRRDRFIGKTAFFQNIDLRLKLLREDNTSLPLNLGIYGGLDHGRVWYPGESFESETWHYSYGGGLFISPFDIVTINMGLFKNDEGISRFNLGSSFFF